MAYSDFTLDSLKKQFHLKIRPLAKVDFGNVKLIH